MGNPRRLVLLTISTIAIAVIVAIACNRPSGPPSGIESFDVPSQFHSEGNVAYAQNPPVGGDHWPVWQNCGFYSSPIPSELAVHSLEHGAVWITFQPDLPAAQVDRIRKLTVGDGYVLSSPYPGLPSRVVASAWGRQLRLDSADDSRLDQFIKAFRQGPTAPERAPCSGGVG
jgi:hypothetical protein